MLCLSGFELYSRWVPLDFDINASHFIPVSPAAASLPFWIGISWFAGMSSPRSAGGSNASSIVNGGGVFHSFFQRVTRFLWINTRFAIPETVDPGRETRLPIKPIGRDDIWLVHLAFHFNLVPRVFRVFGQRGNAEGSPGVAPLTKKPEDSTVRDCVQFDWSCGDKIPLIMSWRSVALIQELERTDKWICVLIFLSIPSIADVFPVIASLPPNIFRRLLDGITVAITLQQVTTQGMQLNPCY